MRCLVNLNIPMMINENKWQPFQLPNTPLLRCKLSDDIIKYLWNCIEDAIKENISVKNYLAGNISESLYLTDKYLSLIHI